MIVHVWRRAMAAEGAAWWSRRMHRGDIAAVRAAGGEAVMTRADQLRAPTASSRPCNRRSRKATSKSSSTCRAICPRWNRPGRAIAWPRSRRGSDIATIAAEITGSERAHQPECGEGRRHTHGVPDRMRALYFTRATAPHGEGRFTITSASMPIAAPRSSASSGCRLRRWRTARGSSSCGRWKTACASM